MPDRYPIILVLTLISAACIGVSQSVAAATKIEISGIDDELEENVRLFVGKPLNERERTLDRFERNLPDQAKIALSALGYYGADVDVDRRVEGKDIIIAIDVQPNDPVRIDTITLRVEGDAQKDGKFMPVIADIPLRRRAVFVSGDYEGTKSVLLDRAQDLGYFELAFTTAEVRVSRQRQTADITLIAESGPRYIFGDIVFDNDFLDEAFLRRWLPFTEGDPYEASKLAELTRNLQGSSYFDSVRVVPQRDARYEGTVPVRVTLARRDHNLVGLGLGYATEDKGVRGKISWNKPLINRLGHSASAEMSVSRVRQSASVGYRIPRGTKPLFNYYSFEYGLQNTVDDEEDLKSFLSTANVQRVSLRRHDWTESIFLRWEREYSTISGDERRTDLVLPGISFTRTRTKGSPFLTWGQAEEFTFMYGSRELLSTIDFYKSVVAFKYIRAVSERNTLIGTLQYGAISSNDFERVPASQRFFAGGDRSIRGYRYRDVSPRNLEGDSVGGRYLEVLNAEYNYRFADLWTAAVFVDAGRAFNSFSHPYSAGAGFGIRWQSPVGPFRLDIAHPIDSNPLDRGIRVHISLGPDL